jgi:hypothetical protein
VGNSRPLARGLDHDSLKVLEILMFVFRGTDSPPFGPVRVHPYEKSDYDANVQYYDFGRYPELIRLKLEDFKAWGKYPAVDAFYQLLEWIRSDLSVFESNDCALQGPAQNTLTKASSKKFNCAGRLMIFYRSLGANLQPDTVNSLLEATGFYLQHTDEHFTDGQVGLSFFDTAFEALQNRIGKELVIEFIAFGDTEEECFANLNRVFVNIRYALQRVNEHALEAKKQQT